LAARSAFGSGARGRRRAERWFEFLLSRYGKNSQHCLGEGTGHDPEGDPRTARYSAGEVLEFDEDAEGRVVATKLVTRDPVDDVYGILRLTGSTDEFIERLRGEPDAT